LWYTHWDSSPCCPTTTEATSVTPVTIQPSKLAPRGNPIKPRTERARVPCLRRDGRDHVRRKACARHMRRKEAPAGLSGRRRTPGSAPRVCLAPGKEMGRPPSRPAHTSAVTRSCETAAPEHRDHPSLRINQRAPGPSRFDVADTVEGQAAFGAYQALCDALGVEFGGQIVRARVITHNNDAVSA
jgi:hypothetical protein